MTRRRPTSTTEISPLQVRRNPSYQKIKINENDAELARRDQASISSIARDGCVYPDKRSFFLWTTPLIHHFYSKISKRSTLNPKAQPACTSYQKTRQSAHPAASSSVHTPSAPPCPQLRAALVRLLSPPTHGTLLARLDGLWVLAPMGDERDCKRGGAETRQCHLSCAIRERCIVCRFWERSEVREGGRCVGGHRTSDTIGWSAHEVRRGGVE
jgi:hypothetical protein